MQGTDRLPDGPALLVANHAFGFWDVGFGVARIRAHTGRTVSPLGEHAWWRVPIVRRLACAIGIVDGTKDNADAPARSRRARPRPAGRAALHELLDEELARRAGFPY